MAQSSFNFKVRFRKITPAEEKDSNYHTYELVISGIRIMLKMSQKGDLWLNKKYVVQASGKIKAKAGTRTYPRIEPDSEYLELTIRNFPRYPTVTLPECYYPHCKYNPTWNYLDEEEWMLHPLFLCQSYWTTRIEIIHENL